MTGDDSMFKIGNVTASVEAVAHYNLLLTQAIFDALVAKGILTKEEVTERLQKLKAETKLNFEAVQ
jgi:hypothetical protein